MRMGLCLALLVCAALMSNSDAFAVLKKIKSVATKAVNWVKDNCSITSTEVGCDLTGLGLGKRALNEALLAHQQMALDDVCADLDDDFHNVTNGGVPFNMVKDVFEEVDGGSGGDDLLDETEYAQFMVALEVFERCVSN